MKRPKLLLFQFKGPLSSEWSICDLKLWKMTLGKLTFCQVHREGADSYWGVRVSGGLLQDTQLRALHTGVAAAGGTAQSLDTAAPFSC